MKSRSFMPSLGMFLSAGAISLVLLVLQNSSLVLLTRYSRHLENPYHTSTLVLLQETLKLIVCIGILGYERQAYTVQAMSANLKHILLQWDVVKFLVPAILFTLQNFLLFISLSHLDAMTFQVLSQTKLISAAVFSVWMLDRKLSGMQWVSLLLLTGGVVLTQMQGSGAKRSTDTLSSSSSVVIGVVSCVVSGISSSFAGVYFEKVVKTTPPSLAVRNIQLSVFGVPLAIFSMLVIDGIPGRSFAFWQGYQRLSSWVLVVLHAGGGLLVAIVVKYADNILKGFATGVAIIVSGIFASMFWGFQPSIHFVGGSLLVILSSVLYQWADQEYQKELTRQKLAKEALTTPTTAPGPITEKA
eukprot:PhF_6_TR41555/c0_g1_i1/m.62950/K15272/SLC35A1_2_3; solute carrier family 35 (UDP-sugar transporter), member A1/2/3